MPPVSPTIICLAGVAPVVRALRNALSSVSRVLGRCGACGLDPHTSRLVRLGPQSWPALAPDRCPPWPTILARLDLLWASNQKFQAGIVQYNQFAVDAGTSDTKCRRSRRWDSNQRRCDCLSQPSSTQPTAPQEYSGGEADRVWPGAYHRSLSFIQSRLVIFETKLLSTDVCFEDKSQWYGSYNKSLELVITEPIQCFSG